MHRLVVIGGPTASGKTALAIEWALKYNTEILSADSRQCYRELGIGVAKPSLEELHKVPHHFINSHSIHEEISAADYEEYGLHCLTTLFQQYETVVCVGGTGLYIKALCEGLDAMPSINKTIQLETEEQYHALGLNWLQAQLQQEDVAFFESGDRNNPARLLRALIFKRSTGKSILQYRTGQQKTRPFHIDYFLLEPDRNTLYERINKRVDVMIQQGLVDEARNLYPYRTLKNLQTVGYQELFAHFNGECSLEESIDKIKQHSRNYAKRQLTWFKNQGHFVKIIN
ncbi:MAG: tRNA (adenosine(37)-N6)-dimethylallyltransferase MiaA [Chitinophagaceae bacterium]|nr:tRNA (adenosine(37)-N6)-dimethylallyltransferase MiaA [Chitinophagaceae bacterium]